MIENSPCILALSIASIFIKLNGQNIFEAPTFDTLTT